MKSGRYVSIQSFRDVFTMSQTALVKLIVIENCKDFLVIFGLRQLPQPALLRLPICWYSRKIFHV